MDQVTLDEAKQIFNMPDEILHSNGGDDCVFALASSYYQVAKDKYDAINESFDDFMEHYFSDPDLVRIFKTAMQQQIRFPTRWNKIAVEALRELLTDINYHKAAGDLVVLDR